MALHEYQKQMYKKIGVIAALVILPIAGFFAGMQYQKQTNPAAADTTGRFASGGPRMLRGGAIGTVKSISDTSITVTERMNDEDKTYTLTSSTTYKDGTDDAQASDVKTGDTVLLTLDSSDSTKVKSITINPAAMFGGSDDGGPGTNTMIQ